MTILFPGSGNSLSKSKLSPQRGDNSLGFNSVLDQRFEPDEMPECELSSEAEHLFAPNSALDLNAKEDGNRPAAFGTTLEFDPTANSLPPSCAPVTSKAKPSITLPLDLEPDADLNSSPVLAFCPDAKPGKAAYWQNLFGPLGVQVFFTPTLAEAMAILSECEKLGAPVGLIALDVDTPSELELEAICCFREWRQDAELPILVRCRQNDPQKRLLLAQIGANAVFSDPIDESYFLLRAKQCLRSSARTWRLLMERQHAEYLLELHKHSSLTQDLWRLDLASRTIEFNDSCRELSGYRPSEIGSLLDDWLSLIHPADLLRLSEDLAKAPLPTADSTSAETTTREDIACEFRLRHRSGSWRWAQLQGRVEQDETGRAVGVTGSYTDITKAKTTDSVTSLPNRSHLEDWIFHNGAKAQTDPLGQEGLLGVFVVGIDRFALVRDSLASDLGDQLLRSVGDRLRHLTETAPIFANQKHRLARVGGDEFAIALLGVSGEEHAKEIAESIENRLSKGYWLGGKEIFTSLSCGFALDRPQSPADAAEVWRNAEIALHSAKAAGGARTVSFDHPLRKRVVERMELENELNRAIENWEFEIFYQPKVTLSQERVIGFEALLRWRHPEKGIIPPNFFIPLAEANGLIVPLGIRTIREACKTLKSWQSQYPQDPPLEMSVNLSVRQFRDVHLLDEVRKILAETQIPHQSLLFEVTESVLVDEPERALQIVEELRRLGIGLKIDDFGTGYSSLSYLHRLPFDSLKIDRSFINSMGQDHAAYEIVKAIISLADSLGLQVVAEGVENRSQAEELRNMGCKYGQGYLFAPPLTGDSARRLLGLQGRPKALEFLQPAPPR